MSLTIQQLRVLKVLDNIKNLCTESEENANMFSDDFDRMLDKFAAYDAFGTEMQNDPRGDFRNGSWDMWFVEDVDE